MNRFARQLRCFKRCYSEASLPLIRKNIFTTSEMKPIVKHSTQQNKASPRKHYLYLNELQYNSNEEKEAMCFELISIINKEILNYPSLADGLYNGVKDKLMKKHISKTLENKFKDDQIKLSIFKFISKPNDKETRDLFFTIFKQLLNTDYSLLFNYFDKIVRTTYVNSQLYTILPKNFTTLLEIVPKNQHLKLHGYILHLNLKVYPTIMYEKFYRELKKVARTPNDLSSLDYGLFNPSVYTSLDWKLSPTHRDRLIRFYSVKRLYDIARRIDQPAKALFVVNCMVDKFEQMCQNSHYKIRIYESLPLILKAIYGIVLKFHGSDKGAHILNYLLQESFKIDFSFYLMLLKTLRKEEKHDQFITVLNGLNLDSISKREKSILVHEILSLIKEKFPTSPKVLMGYIGALFSDGFELLSSMKLMKLSEHPLANVDTRLRGLKMDNFALSMMYEVYFNSMDEVNTKHLNDLYQSYIESNIRSDSITKTFLNFLLVIDKDTFHPTIENYNLAKKIYKSSRQMTSSTLAPLIWVALIHHQDINFAMEIVKNLDKNNQPLGFAHFYPIIKYYYTNQNFDSAKVWFDQMMRTGILIPSSHLQEIIDISKEHGWKFNSKRYKYNSKLKLKCDEIALSSISVFNPSMFKKQNLISEITSDIISF